MAYRHEALIFSTFLVHKYILLEENRMSRSNYFSSKFSGSIQIAWTSKSEYVPFFVANYFQKLLGTVKRDALNFSILKKGKIFCLFILIFYCLELLNKNFALH